MNQDIISYYNDRAQEYDQVYLNPPEQEDLQKAADLFQTLFSQKTVLEIACGTGYWTERISKTATYIHATDVNQSVIDIAKERTTRDNVTFSVADMYNLAPEKKYDAVFGGFIWSHILLQDLDLLINQLNGFLKEDGIIVFIDSICVENTNHDIKKIKLTDEYGNTYQIRELENGTTHRVLKNFPSRDFLIEKLSRIATEINFIQLDYYWIVTGKITKTK